MPGETEYDELVMTLVESALQRPPETREEYLRSVCQPNPALYEDVRSRVEWEERMGGFLREPLVVPSEAVHQPFELGEVVGGRFRILREIGRGGMGIVYEAFDRKKVSRIAIKCARLGFRNRLPPEARAACGVSHFNVCKLHDLHTAQTSLGEMDFLTMEFLSGETLAARVKRTGPVAENEAREIAAQVCAGLAQAHRQGVVHGDLKCSNIMLSESADGGSRVVLTDFGLAKLQFADGGAHVTSERGGTLDYMAPELFLGQQASVASDIYALGVLFHVMLTGRAPERRQAPPAPQILDREADASTITLECTVVEAEWQREIEHLPAPWNRVITRCLAPSPEQRFGSVAEISEALQPKSALRKWILSLAFALVTLPVTLMWRTAENPGPPVRLAVLPVVVEGGRIETADGIVQDVAERLSRTRGNFVVIAPGEARLNSVDTAEKAKSVLGATHVLRTNLASSGGQITALATLIDIASGQTLRDLHGAYSRNDAPALAKALTGIVTGAFHLRAGVLADVVSPAAYPYYIQGEALIRRDAIYADQAIPFFKKAIELDPRSALPYAGLAEAQLMKYTDSSDSQWLDHAWEMIDKATNLNPDSARVLQVAGRFKREHGWYEQAAQDFRRATEIEPSNSEAWRGLADVYDRMNLPQEAVATYRKAVAVQPGYYRSYDDFGLFYFYRGRYHEAEDLFRRVTALAPEFSNGHTHLGLTLMYQGRYREAEEVFLRSLRLQESSRILTNLGVLYFGQERFAEAVPFFEKSIAVGPPSAVRYSNLGDGYWYLGRTLEAAAAYRSARTMAEEELARNPRQAIDRALLGWVYAHLGEPDRAVFETAQALGLEPGNVVVIRYAALTYETLHQRDRALEALRGAPARLLEELNRLPIAKDLKQAPEFLELMAKKSIQ